MADVVVTVPKSFGLDTWIEEGQLPGEANNGLEYFFWLGYSAPDIKAGERVYVVYNGRLRGYAPLAYVHHQPGQRCALVRHGGAVACTIDEPIPGFRGFRYRHWKREDEKPFPDWKTP